MDEAVVTLPAGDEEDDDGESTGKGALQASDGGSKKGKKRAKKRRREELVEAPLENEMSETSTASWHDPQAVEALGIESSVSAEGGDGAGGGGDRAAAGGADEPEAVVDVSEVEVEW